MTFSRSLSFALLAFGILVMPGCNRSRVRKKEIKSEVEKQREEAAKRIDNFVYDGPIFLGKKSISEIRKLGKLKNESVNYEDNPYVDGEKLEFRTLEFDGLTLSGIVNDGIFSAISISVTSPQWQIQFGLNVGTPASRVPSALGQPPRPMKGPVESFSGETESVDFTVNAGKITKIEFSYYFD